MSPSRNWVSVGWVSHPWRLGAIVYRSRRSPLWDPERHRGGEREVSGNSSREEAGRNQRIPDPGTSCPSTPLPGRTPPGLTHAYRKESPELSLSELELELGISSLSTPNLLRRG